MTPEETLTSRIRLSSPLRENVKHLFGLSSRLAAERRKLESDQNLSPLGKREKEAAFAKSLVRNFVELGRPCRLAKADAAAKRESFKLPEPDKSDVVAELGRQEIRSYVRSLPRDEQMQAIERLGDTAVLAILHAPPMLSGLPEDRYQHVKNAYIERQFGSQNKGFCWVSA